MSIRDAIRNRLRAFLLGPAVEPWAEDWGYSAEHFAPPAYVKYLAGSNPFYAGATLRADLLASLPLRFFSTVDGMQEEQDDSRIAELFRHINPHWTFNRFVRMTELSLCTWGQSFAFLNRGVSGAMPPWEIWWVRGDRVRVIPSAESYVGAFVYEPMGGGEPLVYSPQETFWLRHPNLENEYVGLSNLAAARLGADLVRESAQSNLKMFQQGMHAGGTVTPPEGKTWTSTAATKFAKMLSRRFKGAQGHHRWIVLEEEAQFEQLGVSPKDAEWIGGLNWGLEDVSRALRIPIDLMGGDRRTYENFETALKALWMLTVIPEGSFFSTEIVEQIAPMFGDAVIDSAVFDSTGVEILQEDRTEIVEQLARLVEKGVPLNVALNEIAPQFLPGDDFPGERTDGAGGYAWGNDWYAPLILAPVQAGPPAAPPPPDSELEAEEEGSERVFTGGLSRALVPEFGGVEHSRLFRQFERKTQPWEARWEEMTVSLFERQQDSALDRLRRDGGSVAVSISEPIDQPRWIREFRESSRPLIAAILAAFGADAIDDLELERIGVEVAFDLSQPDAQRFIEARAQRFAVEVNETTWERLRQSISDGIAAGESTDEVAGRVESIMGVRIRSDAATISRTEVNGASNGGTLEGWRQTQGVVQGKGWLSALVPTTRDNHEEAHGQIVPLSANFQVGRGSGPHPGAIGLAAEDINCLCAMVAILDVAGLEPVFPEVT